MIFTKKRVALVTTVNDATATTYLGDVTIGVPTDNNSDGTTRDYFTALNWQAGANSMVHVGRPYHNPTGANAPFPLPSSTATRSSVPMPCSISQCAIRFDASLMSR